MNVSFVTGATGLVGSHLLYDLLLNGYSVKALKRPQSDVTQIQKTFEFLSQTPTIDVEALFQKIEWIDGDILDFQSMSDAINGCTQVYHAAAVVSFSKKDKAEMKQTNVGGTANIVNVCVEKNIPLCFVSSIAALGNPSSTLLTEDGYALITEKDYWHTTAGRSAYSGSKYKAEMEVWRGIAEGLKAVIVNPSVILGAGDSTKSSSKLFAQVQKGLRFHTPGITGFVDVRDVSRCMLLLMEQEHYGERFILSANNLSYRELFNMIADNLKMKRPTIAAKPWMLNIVYRFLWFLSLFIGKSPALTKETVHSAFKQNRYSNEKIEKTLEYKFITLEKCIEECCGYYAKEKE